MRGVPLYVKGKAKCGLSGDWEYGYEVILNDCRIGGFFVPANDEKYPEGRFVSYAPGKYTSEDIRDFVGLLDNFDHDELVNLMEAEYLRKVSRLPLVDYAVCDGFFANMTLKRCTQALSGNVIIKR